ncbi:peptidase [Hirsutella rhossiliensis]|uniref:Peptide hydrolase n=1 Tax=Hirsutella rhossiliensis TaxID=111463 RepID=A0A9P8SHB6_9HYPO|nr:peptidase family m20/M25/M40 domain-containing protein [Hirsutella rhossiliensis]KAH0962671.1 peptidase family m20/M25/M40 domain-containing protein [Hirsutella rhossiliensis]
MRPAPIAAALLALAPPSALCASQKLLSGALVNRTPSPSPNAPSYRDQLLRLHKSLVSIESISGNETKVGRFLADHLQAKGYTVDRQCVAPRAGFPNDTERFNLLAWQGGKRAKARVVLTSHIDVVPPYIPYQIDHGKGPATKDTVIKGRGSVDAKASVAAMVVALDQLLAAQAIAHDDVMLVFVVGEEVGGDGMRAFSDSLGGTAFDSVIFGEPTENKLACGHKGGLFCEVTATGTPGHSGYPWLGKSANELMVRAMARLIDADLGSSDLFGNTTVNIGRFAGGVAANVIAEHALVGLAVRVAIGREEDGAKTVQRKIQAILDQVDEEALAIKCPQGYGPVECNCDVPDFETIVVNYGTDVPNLKGNHTNYLYGPGSILVAHGARENLTVGDLETAVEGYKKLILHALKQ